MHISPCVVSVMTAAAADFLGFPKPSTAADLYTEPSASHPLTSRVTGVHTAAALPVSLAGCPASWNLTSALAEDEAAAGADWWPHLRLYEVS